VSGAQTLLEVSGLRVNHPIRTSLGRRRGEFTAVRDVSFEIKQGQIFGLVGESGCGKTTLAKTIIGLGKAAAGSVKFRQRDMQQMDQVQMNQARREIQFIFQDPLAALSPRRNIWQALQEPLRLYAIGTRESHQARIENVLHMVGIQTHVLRQYPHELSGGQRQRVVLARALVSEPRLIIADEPMSSLDVSVQARMIGLIRKIQQELGVAFLLISHDLAVVQQLADQVAVMYLGQLVESGPASQVFANPAHPYTQALFDAVPAHLESGFSVKPISGEPPSALTPPAGCVFHTRCPKVRQDCYSSEPGETMLTEIPGGKHKVRCHLCNS
jgi:oligopeptide/dipeptide ABC transporter ATP-binding protein